MQPSDSSFPSLNRQQNGKGGDGLDPGHDALPEGRPIDPDTLAELEACLQSPEDAVEMPDVENEVEIGDYGFVYQAVVDNPGLWDRVPSGRARLAITRMAWKR